MKYFLTIFLVVISTSSLSKEDIKIETTLRGQPDTLNAIFHETDKNNAAVILVHSGGGWTDNTTGPLAKKLNDEGISTLELKFYSSSFEGRESRKRTDFIAHQAFDALNYLISEKGLNPKRVGIAGFSMGAHMAIFTSSEKLSKENGGGNQFSAHAAMYPSCWLMSFIVKGEKSVPGIRLGLQLDSDILQILTGAPIKIYGAGNDDYDDRDPNACPQMVSEFNEKYRSNINVTVYPNATHGWNQKSKEFFVPFGCKGKGCKNRMLYNPNITKKNTLDVVNFFKTTLTK